MDLDIMFVGYIIMNHDIIYSKTSTSSHVCWLLYDEQNVRLDLFTKP